MNETRQGERGEEKQVKAVVYRHKKKKTMTSIQNNTVSYSHNRMML